MAKKKPPPLSHFGGPSNLKDPQQFATGVQSVVNVVKATPENFIREGQEWYLKVHDAAQKATRGPRGGRRNVTLEQNAGIIAATSPNMDFENVNIHALHEVHQINKSGWDVIAQSAAEARQRDAEHQERNRARKRAGLEPLDKPKVRRRSPAADALLKGMSLSQSTDDNLVKAHRIMDGEPIDEVLHPIRAPKTNSFARNIIDPEGREFRGLTIDGRAHDLVRNQLIPWGTTRSIGGTVPARARYDDFVSVYDASREVVEGNLGISAPGPVIQAIAWVGGKHLERMMTTKGWDAKQGPARKGQRYW